ncbi:uncharacterized protein PFL1_01110 [Pseudozyma flocculosa PF-1]|uniref:RRM domain-containing protein n=1 Tax=Pseudozyma flocculosa TaxID=84751 RepID=A0A5C3FBS0_9BASI|nr:uncharacterized protein PFL1_01110 [Pseudozyma flocculosa PF-1]EPQ31778.1 hypothetical protein PFL1_01110 [Pseudozyma flocculosa PF-1]SPO41832.1 uncharacterized protein PSFLO_07314 [Pseudozyma flocculosa]
MSSRLLNQSLGQLGQKDRRAAPGGGSSRNSPYNRPDRSSSGSDGAWKHDMFDAHNAAGARGRGPRGGPGSAGASLKPTAKLTIDNLHYEVSDDELRDLFERIGPVVKAFIKYDRSGRSTGQAVVIYESADDAAAAKGEYDGAKAKGQVITITQEMRAERPPRGNASAAAAADGSGGKDLLSRFDLLSRMGGPKPEAPRNAPRGPAADSARSSGGGRASGRPGPQRSVSGGGRQQSTGRSGGREKRKPATQADLDAELEAFMKAPPGAAAAAQPAQQPAAQPAPAPAPNSTAASMHAVPTEDVEMS